MSEYLITYIAKEWFLRQGWDIIAFNPPGSQGTFTIPNPSKAVGYRGQTGSLSPDLVASKIIRDHNHIAIVEAKPSYNQRDIEKMLNMFEDPRRLDLFFKIVRDQCAANNISLLPEIQYKLHFFKAHSGKVYPIEDIGTVHIQQLDNEWDLENFSPEDDIYSKFSVTLYGKLPKN